MSATTPPGKPIPGESIGVRIDRAALLAWGGVEQRDLPWRRTRDPWAVLVSELMLQQTQVTRVVPKYEAFLSRYPDPATCAAASQADIVRQWEGLGYNRRARHLHRTARLTVERHGGTIPDDLDALLELPGVGPYTARAVLVFAYERDVAPVDTNVARLLARWAGEPLTASRAQRVADRLVPRGEAWAWTQALFDLGSAVCTRRRPACDRCPVRTGCAWAGRGVDPADGSAGVSRGQSRFEGSDRQGRGRLIAALRGGPVSRARVAEVVGWPDEADRAARMLAGLEADGLVVREGDTVRLADAG